MKRNPNGELIAGELIDELVRFCKEDAPESIPHLYEGLDTHEIEEVVTDALARVLSWEQNEKQGESSVAKALMSVRDVFEGLLEILPHAENEAWERRKGETIYTNMFIPEGLYPGLIKLSEDQGEIPGMSNRQDDDAWWTDIVLEKPLP